jgi:superfamily II DNA or RNA helicase
LNITVSKINESYLKIASENYEVLTDIENHFKFRPNGYKFNPKFKAKIWDGWIRLFSPTKRVLSFGLLKFLHELCEEKGYTVSYDNFDSESLIDSTKTIKEVTDYISDGLVLTSDGIPLEPYIYQLDTVHKCLQEKRLLVLSPTASGKSLIIYCVIRMLLRDENRILLVTPNISLVKQMASDFADYSTDDNGFDSDRDVSLLFAGQEKTNLKPITISTFQSIAGNKNGEKVERGWFAQFDCVIVDEAHTAESVSIQYILENSINASYRLGFTGTVDNTKTNIMTLNANLGETHRVISTKKLMDDDKVTKLQIKSILLKYSKETDSLFKKTKNQPKPEYHTEIDYLIAHEKRNKLIRSIALNTKGNTVILTTRVGAHLIPLYDLIKQISGDRKVFMYHGEIHPDEREKIRKEIDDYSDCIVVSNYQTMSTGINIKSLSNIIFASPIKTSIKVLQSIGRVLRKYDGKDICTLYDIGDQLTSGTASNYTYDFFLGRLKIYMEENFEYKVTQIQIE